MRDRLFDGLKRNLDGVRLNGPSSSRRLPHNLHVSFDDIEGEALLMALGDLAVSTGSACSSGSQAPSHVLQAIGAVGDRAGASIRFGLGRPTTDHDIDFAIDRVTTVVRALADPQRESVRLANTTNPAKQEKRNACDKNHRRAQSRFRRRVHVFRSGQRPRRHRRHRGRSGAVRHRDASTAPLSKAATRSRPSRFMPTRISSTSTRPASPRREHGRQVRADRCGAGHLPGRAGGARARDNGVKGKRIAIPGTLTTAYLTLRSVRA